MTELEKIAYAKSFIDKLAQGINPLDDTPVPEGDIVNNVRLSRCFFFVSDILRQVIDNGGTVRVKYAAKAEFAPTAEQLSHFEYSTKALSVSEIARRVNSTIDADTMKCLQAADINKWLLAAEMIYVKAQIQKRKLYHPTDAGMKLGISPHTYQSQNGEFTILVYNESAQRLIIDNMDAIIALKYSK